MIGEALGEFLRKWGMVTGIGTIILLSYLIIKLRPLMKRTKPWFLVRPSRWPRQRQFAAGKRRLDAIVDWGNRLADSLGIVGNTWFINLWFGGLILIGFLLSPILFAYWLIGILPNHWFWYRIRNPRDSSTSLWIRRARSCGSEAVAAARRRESSFGLIVLSALVITLIAVELFAILFVARSVFWQTAWQKSRRAQTTLGAVPDRVISAYIANRRHLQADETEPYPVTNGAVINVDVSEIRSVLGQWSHSSSHVRLQELEEAATGYVYVSDVESPGIDRRVYESRTLHTATPRLELTFKDLPPDWLHEILNVHVDLGVSYRQTPFDTTGEKIERIFPVFIVSQEEMDSLESHVMKYWLGLAIAFLQIGFLPLIGLSAAYLVEVIKDFKYWRS